MLFSEIKVWIFLWRGKKVRQKGWEGLSQGTEYKREKEEGAVEECVVLMRSRGRQPLIEFCLITIWHVPARTMYVEAGIILALQPVPEGWTQSQTVDTSALTFLLKGFINSSTVLQGAPLPLSALKALILWSCQHCSRWSSIWPNLGAVLFTVPCCYMWFGLSCQSLCVGQEQGLVHWQGGGSAEPAAAHVIMDLQSLNEGIWALLLVKKDWNSVRRETVG